ncbi:MAG: hypothetical protein U0T73_08425 [Chitinophagales bacterium]
MRLSHLSLAAMLLTALIFTSCKKNDSVAVDNNSKQHNEDVSNSKSESDNLNTDVNTALSNISGFGKNEGVQSWSVCGATIDSSQQHGSTPTIIITFDGTTLCNNRIRGGIVKVELISGSHWSDAGAMLRITHTNYKVTFPSLNNHSLTFNGVKYLTDVNGINWINVYFGTSTILLKERSYNMTVTFDNGNTASWNIARRSEWGISNGNIGQIYAIVNGDTTINGKTIDSWGVTRFGTNFVTQMVQPWKSGTACGWWRPTQGIYTSTTDNFTITATFGVDQNGNQIASGCAYGFKLNWNVNNGGSTGETTLAYW